MKTKVLAVLLLLGLGGISVGAQADKVLIDPNTPSTASASKANDGSSDFWADTRLSIKLTYNTSYKPIRLILADVSKLTGVTLHSGLTNQDWQVRDRKMNIYVTDISLAELMKSMARVMKFKWSRNTNVDPITYRLVMDRKSLLKENQQSERSSNKLQAFIDDIGSIAQMSTHDMAALRTENPYLYALASTGTASALSQFFAEVPMAKDALTNGESVNVSELIPADSRSTQLELLRSILRMNALEKNSDALSPEMLSTIELAGVHMNSLGSPGGYYIGDMQVGYRRPGEDELHEVYLNIRNPGIPSNQSYWSVVLDAQNEKISKSEINERVSRKEKEEGITNDEVKDLAERAVDQPDDPTLNKDEVTVSVEKNSDSRLVVSDYESAFAKASGLSVVSDSFAQHRDEMKLTKGEITPGAFLKRFAKAFNYNWWKRGSVVELRNREWFKKRSLQIPDAKLENLRAAIKKNRELGLDDLAEIGILSDEQYALNILGDPALDNPNLKLALSTNGGWLSLYSKLLPNQRRVLCSETYLSGDLLNTEQRAILKGYIAGLKIVTQNGPLNVSDPGWIAAVSENGKIVLKVYRKELSSWFPLSFIPVPSYSLEK